MAELKCAACGVELPTTTAEEEARAAEEAMRIFGVADPENHPGLVRICDDCHNLQTPEQREALGRAFQVRQRWN